MMTYYVTVVCFEIITLKIKLPKLILRHLLENFCFDYNSLYSDQSSNTYSSTYTPLRYPGFLFILTLTNAQALPTKQNTCSVLTFSYPY